MKTILNRRTIIILSTALLLAIISIVSINVFNNQGPVTGFANAVTMPVRTFASTIARTFANIFSSIYEYEQMAARVDELQRRIAEMETDYRESEGLAEENRNLRALLNFSERHRNYESVIASYSGPGSDNWSSTFIINIGSNSGIAPGMPVMTSEGVLIGQVYEVGTSSSTVISVFDTKFSASVFIGTRETRDASSADSPAVARGDFTYMSSNMLVLEKIDENLTVRAGDFVLTTGYGGVFPSGLLIGEIHSVSRQASGIDRFALITSLVSNYDTLTDVYVITDFIRRTEE